MSLENTRPVFLKIRTPSSVWLARESLDPWVKLHEDDDFCCRVPRSLSPLPVYCTAPFAQLVLTRHYSLFSVHSSVFYLSLLHLVLLSLLPSHHNFFVSGDNISVLWFTVTVLPCYYCFTMGLFMVLRFRISIELYLSFILHYRVLFANPRLGFGSLYPTDRVSCLPLSSLYLGDLFSSCSF